MKAAKLTEHPSFRLLRQTDVQNVWHMQMPRWLFSDPRYADMSLDAKVAYTFLLNRFQLSRRNGWVNDAGEVFVIFPRKALAKELRICEQRVTAAFRKLAELQLIWEKRCGRGDANQIYLASVTPIDDPGYECAPFCSESYESCGSRTADSAFLDTEEPQDTRPQNPEIPAFRTADPDVPEPQDSGASNTDLSQPDIAFSDVSPSVPSEDGPADDEKELTGILDACELSYFEPEVARVFENAIERLFYSDNLRIGQAVLPQSRVRSRLHLLNYFVLQEAEINLRGNRNAPVRDSTKYVMSTIYNCITETESNLMVDPYLNSLRSPPGKGRG
mgnify:FL=1|jgi:hypothetical protein